VNNLLTGIDIGTQGTTCAVYDENGSQKAEAFQPSCLLYPSPDAVEEDPGTQFLSVISTIKSCVQQLGHEAGNIAAIAIDGQMAGIIGINADGKHITPYDSWLDTRCAPQIKQMNDAAAQNIIQKNGCAASFNHGPKKLWWKQQHPGVYKHISAFVQPGSYVAMRLCGLNGAEAFIDHTYIHFSGFANNQLQQWDDELCNRFSFDQNKLPRIIAPQTVIGHITGEMAAATGLKQGIPVVAGCGDSAASFLGAGAVEKGVCIDLAGTASVFCSTTDQLRADVQHGILGCSRAVLPGLWHHFAYINGGGQNLEWFKQHIAGGLLNDAISFDTLNDAAEKIGDDYPLFIPHLSGRVCPGQPQLRGAWLQIKREHGVPHFYKSALEAVALEYGIYLSVIKELQSDFVPVSLRITGGGSKSNLWNRIKADLLQMPVTVLKQAKGAPLGSALLAGFGVGLFSDLKQASNNWVQAQTTFESDKTKKHYAKKRLQQYKTFLTAINVATEAGNA
jgi:xylulokinase